MGSFVWGQIPFIVNIDHKKEVVRTKDIDANGTYSTRCIDAVNVGVKEAGALTPAAQEEILNEEY